MGRGAAWWTATVLGTASLLAVGAQAVLVPLNQSLANQVAARRDFIGQTAQVGRVTQFASSALAERAGGDEAIQTLLTRSGFVIGTRGTAPQ